MDCARADAAIAPELARWRPSRLFEDTYAQIYHLMCWGTHGSTLTGWRHLTVEQMQRTALICSYVTQQHALYCAGAALLQLGRLDDVTEAFNTFRAHGGAFAAASRGKL